MSTEAPAGGWPAGASKLLHVTAQRLRMAIADGDRYAHLVGDAVMAIDGSATLDRGRFQDAVRSAQLHDRVTQRLAQIEHCLLAAVDLLEDAGGCEEPERWHALLADAFAAAPALRTEAPLVTQAVVGRNPLPVPVK